VGNTYPGYKISKPLLVKDMIYSRKTRKAAYLYFIKDAWFKGNLHLDLREKALRVYLTSGGNVITMKEVADSEIGQRCLKSFYGYARKKPWFSAEDEKCTLGAILALYDIIKALFKRFDEVNLSKL
jgi:hypothetical protein